MSNYRLWAPYATEVELLTGDSTNPEHTPMHATTGGWFEAPRHRSPGERYAFRLRAAEGHGRNSVDDSDQFQGAPTSAVEERAVRGAPASTAEIRGVE